MMAKASKRNRFSIFSIADNLCFFSSIARSILTMDLARPLLSLYHISSIPLFTSAQVVSLSNQPVDEPSAVCNVQDGNTGT